MAEHASARWGGEAILPVHYFRNLRNRDIDAHLIVHERTRDELVELFPDEGNRMHFIRDSRFQKLCLSTEKYLPSRVHYFTFGWLIHLQTQKAQIKTLRRLEKEGAINLIHEVIPVSPKLPSRISSRVCKVVIGPLNGGMTYPPGFQDQQAKMERLFSSFGRAATNLLNTLIPGKKKADLILVANNRTRLALPGNLKTPVLELVENGVDLRLWRDSKGARDLEKLRFVFIGRLVDWKAVDQLLLSFRQVLNQTGKDIELHIVGDGPLGNELKDLAGNLELAGKVVFHGFVPQKECPAILSKCHVLVLPSIYECGGAVVLEAMAMSMAVIATDWGGPADYITEETGILVPPASRSEFQKGLAKAMLHFCTHMDDIERMGQNGRKRVEEVFDWERKTDRIIEIYNDVLGSPARVPPGRPEAIFESR